MSFRLLSISLPYTFFNYSHQHPYSFELNLRARMFMTGTQLSANFQLDPPGLSAFVVDDQKALKFRIDRCL